jgi:large subunit ribosomal protein L32e
MSEKDKVTLEKALRLRSRIKSKKPNFVRHESWRYVRLKENWRRPKGIDNKMRRKVKGWPQTVSVGYRGPKTARNLHPSGYEEVLVYNIKDLERVDNESQAVRIAHTVGKKTRLQILAAAKEKGIFILNPGEMGKGNLEKVTEETKEEPAEIREAEADKTETLEKQQSRNVEKKQEGGK